MSEDSKQVIEKNLEGDYHFTHYGEFLSYFHTHVDLFKKFLKSKSVLPEIQEKVIADIKAFMTKNIKKTDHFFEHVDYFAQALSSTKDEISLYLNTNFIETLAKIQAKLKETEIQKIKNAPKPLEKVYTSVLLEIVETLPFEITAKCFFRPEGNKVVYVNPTTGEVREPVGAMSPMLDPRPSEAIAVAPLEPQAKPSASQASPTPVAPSPPKPAPPPEPVKILDPPLLKSIVEEFGDILTGQKLNPKIGPEIEETPPTPAVAPATVETFTSLSTSTAPVAPLVKPKSEDDFEEIEDLDFEEESPSPPPQISPVATTVSESPSADVDLSDILGETEDKSSDSSLDFLDDFDTPIEKPELPPPPDEIDLFKLRDFLELTQKIQGFLGKKDQDGYQSWLSAESDLVKCTVSIRTNLQKEAKKEPVNWNSLLNTMSNRTSLSLDQLHRLKFKVSNYQVVKTGLDVALGELKKGTPEFLQIVRMAWPHAQKAFFEVPDFEMVQSQLKTLLSRIKEPDQRKEMIRIFTSTLNYIKSKYKV